MRVAILPRPARIVQVFMGVLKYVPWYFAGRLVETSKRYTTGIYFPEGAVIDFPHCQR